MKARFLEALGSDRIAGNVLVAANVIGISRDTAYEWRNKDSEFASKWQEVITLAVDKKVDLAEDKLFEQVLKGNITAIMYTLRRYKPEVYDRRRNEQPNKQMESMYWHTPSPEFQAIIDKYVADGSLKRDQNGRLICA